jgi:hypothetical protein
MGLGGDADSTADPFAAFVAILTGDDSMLLPGKQVREMHGLARIRGLEIV